jgi:hypothetical protein
VRRRRAFLALTTVLLPLALAACGGAAPPAAQWQQPGATPSSAPAATSAAPAALRPAPKTKAEVRERVTLATLDLSGFHAETATPTGDNDDAWKLARTCEILPSDRQRTAHHERLWDGETVWIRQYVVGYLKLPGRKLLGELRDALDGCKTYEAPDGRAITLVPMRAPTVPDGTEAAAFCERIQGEHVVHQCTAVLARGNFVTQVDVADRNELAASQAMLGKLVPLAATALAKAA